MMKRYGWVIEVRSEKITEYKKLHAAVWPEILKMIKDCNIKNYSIFLREINKGRFYLFSYLEYSGKDFDVDMAKMAADPNTRKWWEVCKPCQKQVETAKNAEWWADMEEVFHLD
jgi:L-rhamnose mutarotase